MGPAQRHGTMWSPHGDHVPVQRTPGGAGTSAATQQPVREISGRAAGRLRLAQDAINHVRRHYVRYPGNQFQALMATNYNSRLRMAVIRHDGFWDTSRVPAGTDPMDLHMAKIRLAKGGACAESSVAVLNYLRSRGPSGENLRIAYVSATGHNTTDHVFVLIGHENEPDSEWVVADAWPTTAKAVVWADYIQYTPNRNHVFTDHAAMANGRDPSRYLAGLIRLNPAGEYAMRWDLNQVGTNPYIIVERLQRLGFAIDFGQPVALQVQNCLAEIKQDGYDWNPVDAAYWSEDKLWLWCLSKVNRPVVEQIVQQGYGGGQTIHDALTTGQPSDLDARVYDQEVTTETDPAYVMSR